MTSTSTNAKDSACLWDSAVPGVELFDAHLFHHRFQKHFHETYTIGLNRWGKGQCQHHGETHTHSPGSFNVINPGDIHTGQVASEDQGWAFRNLYISPAQIQTVLHQLEWPEQTLPAFIAPIIWHPSLPALFNRLFAVLSTSASILTQQTLLLDFLSQLFMHHAEPGLTVRTPQAETQAIATVRAYLEAHHNTVVSIDELARLVNISPYYLIRCFRQQVGCPPHQYQRHWQLLQAKQALRQAVPLSTVATDYGFYDQSHFNRVFKRTFGITPGQYQKDNSVQYNPM